MRSAPNVKLLPKDKFTEAVIFAGADAWAHADAWEKDYGKKIADDDVPPIVLGPKQLVELITVGMRIVDKNRRSVRVYKAGRIKDDQLAYIRNALASAGVKEARVFDGMSQQQPSENWSSRLDSLREEIKRGESFVDNHRKVFGLTADELAPRVESRPDGLYWVTPKVDQQSGELTHPGLWLCDPVKIIGVGADESERFIILEWSPYGAKSPRKDAVPMREIGEKEGWSRLRAGGLSVTAKGHLKAILADYLMRSASGELWTIVHKAGWREGAYIMPNGEIIGTPDKPVIFHGGSAASTGYTVAGTAESWRDSVGRLARGNHSMMLGVAAALSAPVIGIVGADGFGVHLYEQSSAGKTTTANVSLSLYGYPDDLRLSWYGTALGIANEAEAHNDGLMPLDEIGQGAKARDVSASAYTLFNGTGKLQGAKEGGNRELKRWRTVAISTGEMDIETFLSSGGLKVKAGQLVRLINIPMEKAKCFNGLSNGKLHADEINESCINNHGAAGREWIKWISEHREDVKKAARDAKKRWSGLIPDEYGEQVKRVADRFAILEASLIAGKHITGWGEQESRDAIQFCFNSWIREFGTGNREHKQIVEQLEAFLNSYGKSRFAPIPYDVRDLPIQNLAGYRQKPANDEQPIIFYAFPAVFENEISQGFNAKQFARSLAAEGILKPPASGRGYQRKSPRIDGRQTNVYVLQQRNDQEEEET